MQKQYFIMVKVHTVCSQEHTAADVCQQKWGCLLFYHPRSSPLLKPAAYITHSAPGRQTVGWGIMVCFASSFIYVSCSSCRALVTSFFLCSPQTWWPRLMWDHLRTRTRLNTLKILYCCHYISIKPRGRRELYWSKLLSWTGHWVSSSHVQRSQHAPPCAVCLCPPGEPQCSLSVGSGFGLHHHLWLWSC